MSLSQDDPLSERILPSPDIYATCPLDGNILEYYAGTFEAVYVALHPFIKPVSIALDRFTSPTYPSRSELVNSCVPVSWAGVLIQSGLPSMAAIDIGLRTMIGGLKEEFSNQEYTSKIKLLMESHRIFPPTEGYFSDLLHDKILTAIKQLGYRWVWVGDEFCMERKLHWIDDLKSNDTRVTAGHANVFTPDKELLWTTHWDSHFSFLCSSRKNLAAIQEANQFEGFFCTPSTEIYWSVGQAPTS